MAEERDSERNSADGRRRTGEWVRPKGPAALFNERLAKVTESEINAQLDAENLNYARALGENLLYDGISNDFVRTELKALCVTPLSAPVLTAEDLRLLRLEFPFTQYSYITYKMPEQIKLNAFTNWVNELFAISVDAKPGGRAFLREPGKEYRVEIEWHWDRRLKASHIKSARIIADEFLDVEGDLDGPTYSLDLHKYVVRFRLHQLKLGNPAAIFSRAPESRPAPGRSLNIGFYKSLLERYDELLLQGIKDPAAELARREDCNRNTMKSWLSRGRKYVDQGDQE